MVRDGEVHDPVSTHAPAKGATPRQNRDLTNYLFQHTLPRRERRATSMRWWHAHGRFNTRSREGSDSPVCPMYEPPSLFQHTLPRRERLILAYYP